MIYILDNIMPIGAATITALAIGIIWLRQMGLSLPSGPKIAVIALAIFWLAAILAGALILAPPQADIWTMALGSAFIIWIGFVVPVLAVTFLIAGLGGRKIAAASAYWLVVMLVQAAMMQAIGLVGPTA